MTYLKRFIVAIALFLIIFLAAGMLRSGEWTTARSRVIAASPEAIWPWISDLRRWDAWAPLGEVEGIFEAESSGVGAVRAWDDPAWGAGRVTIREVDPGRRLSYDVAVEGGLTATGRLTLEPIPDGGGTRVRWIEEGDFGWNPLLTWFAPGMEKRQGAQLALGLERLRDRVVE
ncbi:MAG: SRPBCC family protein [Longimicrobiales bacterium]|nr:SRPBCC family protein [Longimicrobiales bacterium]